MHPCINLERATIPPHHIWPEILNLAAEQQQQQQQQQPPDPPLSISARRRSGDTQRDLKRLGKTWRRQVAARMLPRHKRIDLTLLSWRCPTTTTDTPTPTSCPLISQYCFFSCHFAGFYTFFFKMDFMTFKKIKRTHIKTSIFWKKWKTVKLALLVSKLNLDFNLFH